MALLPVVLTVANVLTAVGGSAESSTQIMKTGAATVPGMVNVIAEACVSAWFKLT